MCISKSCGLHFRLLATHWLCRDRFTREFTADVPASPSRPTCHIVANWFIQRNTTQCDRERLLVDGAWRNRSNGIDERKTIGMRSRYVIFVAYV